MAKTEIKSVKTGFSSIEALPIIIVYVALDIQAPILSLPS